MELTLLTLLARFWKPLAIALILMAVAASSYRLAKNECKAEQLETIMEAHNVANDVKNAVARLPDGDAAKLLKQHWHR